MKRYGLIGFPLKNTFSATYFNDRFLQQGLTDRIYENFPIQHIYEFPSLIAKYPDLNGLNVTVPHKVTVLEYLDELDESAKAVGAVNCIRIFGDQSHVDSKLVGYNTDVFGFEQSFLPLLSQRTTNKALVLGTGGAAKAVCYVLQKLGITYLPVSRTAKNIDAIPSISYEMIDEAVLNEHNIIINCTPVGMYPSEETLPLPYMMITPQHLAFDLIYHPSETPFLKHCREQGAQIKNGHEMLILQAEKAWEIWQS